MPARSRPSAVFLIWRDTANPEGGGSELYVERIAQWLAAHGWDVTLCCASYPGAVRDEVLCGVRFRRRGGTRSVYPLALAHLLTHRPDVVVDVVNGMPFFAPLLRSRPVVALVHHVHREQWQIIYPGRWGRLGWWIESVLAPRVYRRSRYVTVSAATRADLIDLGVAPSRIQIVPNGLDAPARPPGPRAATPTIGVVARLVPHKQVDHALRVVAELRRSVPGLRMDVVGDGWWRAELERTAATLGVTDVVTFHGQVDDATRDRMLDSMWVLLAPSVKEGWGLSILEAAAHGVPSVAYRSAGGTTESIIDGETGWLVDDPDGLRKRTEELLVDAPMRERMGRRGTEWAAGFDWPTTGARFAEVLTSVINHAGD